MDHRLTEMEIQVKILALLEKTGLWMITTCLC